MTGSVGVRREASSQQNDQLCGPFWAVRLLRDAGIASWDGEPVDQDLLALRADTTLPDNDGEPLPPGARSLTDYRHALARVPPEEAGTAAGALAEVLEAASGGSLQPVPLRGCWTSERVERLLMVRSAWMGCGCWPTCAPDTCGEAPHRPRRSSVSCGAAGRRPGAGLGRRPLLRA
jgi:hypothetical protein